MKLLLSFIAFATIISTAHATVVTITCQNTPSHFLPVTVNAVVGDTIHWTWNAGGHVVGPINASKIPAGAVMFNAPIDASHHTFEYVVTVAGTYNYQCHPATPHGEPGYIVVSPVTGVQQYNNLSNLTLAYPNPCTDKFTVETTSADMICVLNIMGEKIKSVSLRNGQTKVQVDVAGLNAGIYFYSIIKEGIVVETRKLVKE